MAGYLLFPLGPEKLVARPDMLRTDRFMHLHPQRCRAHDQSGLHQRGTNGDIPLRGLRALGHGPHRVPDLQLDIPQQGHELLYGGVVLVGALIDKDHQVDIRMRVQFAATVAADREEGDALLAPVEARPQVLHQFVDETGPQVQELVDIPAGPELVIQPFIGVAAGLAQVGGGITGRFGGSRQVLQQLRRALGHPKFSSLRAVRTSQPWSVTASVCSHWAESRPSRVLTVHPSFLFNFTWRRPALSMGSMVKVMPFFRTMPAPLRP